MEKRYTRKKEKDNSILTSLDKELNAALEDFHKQHGNDFQALVREVKESLKKQNKIQSHDITSYQI